MLLTACLLLLGLPAMAQDIMKTSRKKPAAAAQRKKSASRISHETLTRREFLAAAPFGATMLTGKLCAAAQEKTMKESIQ